MPKRSGPVRYAIYSRCSSDDQAHKDFSTTDVQEGLNRQYIQTKGGQFVSAYKDEGISGTTLKRKDWPRLLADAQRGLFDVIVVTYMSRLGRGDMFTVAEYLLKEAGVKVEMVKEFFSDDMSGHVNKKMTQFVDGMYVEQVRGWTRTKMEAMVNAGYFPGGYAPFGMRKEIATEAAHFHKPDQEPPKRLVADPEQAPILRRAYDLFLECRSQATVREYLAVVAPRNWTTTAVKRLLTNEAYKGVLQFGDWRNETAWTPIIDPQTWQAVQEALEGKARRVARAETADDYTYYLRGRVQCPHCGCPYTQASHHGKTKRVHYYECRRMNGREKCPIGRVNADRLHYTVLNYIDYASRHPTVMHRLIAQSGGWGNADDAQKALRGQLGKQKQSVEMRIANYIKAIGDGRDSPALMAALDKAELDREEVCRQMEIADQEIAAATIKRPTAAQVQESWGGILRVWEVLAEEDREDLLASLVQIVEVTEKEEVILELLPVSISPPLDHSKEFKLNSQMGAGDRLSSIYSPELLAFETVSFRFKVLKGGRSRTKIPRPERQTRDA